MDFICIPSFNLFKVQSLLGAGRGHVSMWGMAHRGGTLVSREGWTAVWQVGVVWEKVVCSRGRNRLGKGLGAWSRTLYIEYIPESRRRPAVSFKLGFDAFFLDTPDVCFNAEFRLFPPYVSCWWNWGLCFWGVLPSPGSSVVVLPSLYRDLPRLPLEVWKHLDLVPLLWLENGGKYSHSNDRTCKFL